MPYICRIRRAEPRGRPRYIAPVVIAEPEPEPVIVEEPEPEPVKKTRRYEPEPDDAD
jgi:hypothetical protein